MNPSTNKFIPVLVVLLIVASFMIGMLYTKVSIYEKGGSAVAGINAGAAAGGANPPAAVPPGPPEGTPVDVDISNAPMLGKADAKVAIVEFTDYQCPFCKQLTDGAMAQIKKEYVDTGKVKIYTRDFPLFQIHPQAQKAGEAANCANEQKKFWEFHDLLFANQSALQIADLKKYAADLGLNQAQFDSCLDTSKYADKIKKDMADGEKVGVAGTPATFVGTVKGNTLNGVQISGAVGFETFKAAIDPLL